METEVVNRYFALQEAIGTFCERENVKPTGLDVILTLGNGEHIASDEQVRASVQEGKPKTWYPPCQMTEGMPYQNLKVPSVEQMTLSGVTRDLAQAGLIYKGHTKGSFKKVKVTLSAEGQQVFDKAVTMLNDPQGYIEAQRRNGPEDR